MSFTCEQNVIPDDTEGRDALGADWRTSWTMQSLKTDRLPARPPRRRTRIPRYNRLEQSQCQPSMWTLTLFIAQFFLTNNGKDTPLAFHKHVYGRWTLYTHKALPVHQVLAGDRNHLGFVLGFPITAGKLLYDPSDITACAGPQITEDETKIFLDQLSGRYLIILFEGHPKAPLIYPDPFCSLSTVYSAQQQIVASTTSLLHYEKGTVPSYPLRVYPDVGFFYYPAALTDYNDCKRLLPNYSLDLVSWQTSRFWPKDPIEPCSERDKEQYLKRAAAVIEENFERDCGRKYSVIVV